MNQPAAGLNPIDLNLGPMLPDGHVANAHVRSPVEKPTEIPRQAQVIG